MAHKKIQSILNFIEVAESNLRSAKILLMQLTDDKTMPSSSTDEFTARPLTHRTISMDESNALEVVEGTFDGEQMVGDNGKVYVVPQNYASKTQLVVGDRMKWISLPDGEKFKLIAPVERDRVTGIFDIVADNYVVSLEGYPHPVKLLKASSTYAMKQLGLQPGDEVAIYIPKGSIPSHGAFINVVKSNHGKIPVAVKNANKKSILDELDGLNDFDLTKPKVAPDEDYF
jgi:hypothetical protein